MSIPLRDPILFIRPPDPGLRYATYEGAGLTLRGLRDAEPAHLGETTGLTVPPAARDHAAVEFSGFIEAPADGVYRFFLDGDGAAMLLVGDDVIVEEGAPWGDVGFRAGYHPLTVRAVNAGRAGRLGVGIEGPGIERQPVPAGMLFR